MADQESAPSGHGIVRERRYEVREWHNQGEQRKRKNNDPGANLGFEAKLWQACLPARQVADALHGQTEEAIWKPLPACRSCGAGREGLGYG